MDKQSKNRRHPFRAFLYAFSGIVLILLSLLIFSSIQTKNSLTSFLNAVFLGVIVIAAGFFLCWRSWLNFSGLVEKYKINYNSPVGKSIAISALAAKGLSDLTKVHLGEAVNAISLIGFLLCIIFPFVVWWRTKNQLSKKENEGTNS